MKNPLQPSQIDAIVAKYEKKSPTTFRARPVRNFLGTLPEHTTFSQDYANMQMDERLYSWKRPIVSAIVEGLNLAHFGHR